MGQSNPSWPERAATNYFTTAANTSEQQFQYVTVDDYRQRTVRAIYVGLFTSGVTARLYVLGRKLVEVDLTRFSNGNMPFEVDVVVPAQQFIYISLQNAAGAALTAVPVVIRYAPDPSAGP